MMRVSAMKPWKERRAFIQYAYLDQPDASDPRNHLRVLCVCIGPFFVKLTWATDMVRFGIF